MNIWMDRAVVSGRYYARGQEFEWKIEGDDCDNWVLTTDDPSTDCCAAWGMEQYYEGESYEDCMEHLRQQVARSKEAAI